jgi:hypothetical protein
MANWAADFELRNNIDPAKIVKRAKHGIHVQKGGEIEATFVGAPCHYQDSKGSWQPIDTALRLNTVSNKYYVPGVAVDIGSDGVASVYGKSWQQKTTRVGIWNPTKKTFAKAWDIPELGAVDGDSFVRSGKGWEYRQRVTESGLKETLTLFTKPSISIPSGSYVVLETYVPGLSAYPDGGLAEWSESGMWFPLPSARDSSGSLMPLPCKRWKAGNYLYTGISAETFDSAVYPLVVDPDFVGGSADGYVAGGSASWSTARTTSTWYDTGSDVIIVGSLKDGANYYAYRGFVLFDSSTIPDAATITAASLTLTVKEDLTSADDCDVQIIKQSWASQNPLSDANREAAYDNCLSGTADDSVWRNTSGVVVNTPYTSGALSVAWPSKTGITYYSLRSSRDYAGTTPTGPGRCVLFSARTTTASYRPTLTVTYTIPVPFFRAPMWGRF